MRPRVRGRAHRVQGPWSEFDLFGPFHPPNWGPDMAALSGLFLGRLGLSPGAYETGDLLVLSAAFAPEASTDRVALALAHARVGGVLADRLAPNLKESMLAAGVPVLESPNIASPINDGDDVVVDFAAGVVEHVRSGRVTVAAGLDPEELQLLQERPALAWYGVHPEPADPDVYEGWPNPGPKHPPAPLDGPR